MEPSTTTSSWRPGSRKWRSVTGSPRAGCTRSVLTLIDFAAGHAGDDVEQAIDDADRLDLIDPERLRLLLDDYAGWNGARLMRDVLDIRTFTMTDSELERRMRPILRRVGLSRPLTQHWVNGYRVDFFWPDIGLVVETDGLRHHRTTAQQAKDRVRDQAHAAAGLTPLRFTRWQVRYEVDHVEAILRAVRAWLVAATQRRAGWEFHDRADFSLLWQRQINPIGPAGHMGRLSLDARARHPPSMPVPPRPARPRRPTP